MSTYKTPLMQAPQSFDNCPEFLERYLNYLSVFKDRKPATVIENCVNLREFCQYIHFKVRFQIKPSTKDAHKDLDITCMNIHELAALTQDDILEYLAFQDTVVQNSTATTNKKITLLRSFYSYLERNAQELEISLAAGNPLDDIRAQKAPRSKLRSLTIRQIQQLLNGVTGDTAQRDASMILLMATSGLSLAEVASLNLEDLDKDSVLIRRPGTESRTAYLIPACREYILAYIKSSGRSPEDRGPMFLSSQQNRRMTTRSIHYRIQKAAGVAGLGDLNITPADLRATAASIMLQSNDDKESEQILKLLGYKDTVGAAQRYRQSRNAASDMQRFVANTELAKIDVG